MTEAAPSAVPAKDGDAHLHELGRDELSIFLYLAFTDAELSALFSALRLSVPGYRVDKLSGVQKADTLADELRAVPTARSPVVAELMKIYEHPALDLVSLSVSVAEEIGFLAVEEDAPVRILWRLLADPDPAVRKLATPVLKELAGTYYGGPGTGAPAAPSPAAKRPAPDAEAQATAQALASARKAQAAAEGAAEHQAEKVKTLQAQLKEARASLAAGERSLAQTRRAATKAEEALAKTKAQLVEAKAKRGHDELERLTRRAEKAEQAEAALLAREERWHAERVELEGQLAKAGRPAESRGASEVPAAVPAAGEDGADAAPLEEVPTTWLKPRFTAEFYDSLEGWDMRIQRTALKQAFLLAENHRHPSLRALPLGGLPGYYRVRVATDVRLIYRRVEGHEVELLSLIDREDLDRYVRQAKTR